MLEAGYMDLYDEAYQKGFEIGISKASLGMLATMAGDIKTFLSEERWERYKKAAEDRHTENLSRHPEERGKSSGFFDEDGHIIKEKWVEEKKDILDCMGFHEGSWDEICAFIEKYPELSAEEFQYQWEITGAESIPVPCGRDERKIHIRMRTAGHTFSYEWLSHIGGSKKTGKSGYAGKYGEGFKIALLCLMKLGGNAVMSSGRWKLRPCEYTEKIEHQKIQMFGYRMEEREDDGFTTLKFRRNRIADLNTWYYVICQLVRNISSDSSQAGEFIKAYPPEKYGI